MRDHAVVDVDRIGTALEVGTVAALAVHNVAVNHVVPAPLDDLFSLAGAAALTAGAKRNGFSWDELGMSSEPVRKGLVVGAGAAALSVAAISTLARLPATRGFFYDEGVMEIGRMTALYQSALRIPAATALVEEVLFRGVLDATLSRQRSPRSAVVRGALLFGLWHVLPTLRMHRQNPAGTELTKGVAWRAVAGTVAATSVAGAGFLLLRRRTGSVVAPIVAHAAINVTAYLHALSVTRLMADSADAEGEGGSIAELVT